MGLGSFQCNSNLQMFIFLTSTQEYYRADVLQLMALAWVGLENILKNTQCHFISGSCKSFNNEYNCLTFLPLEWLESQTNTVGNNTTQ